MTTVLLTVTFLLKIQIFGANCTRNASHIIDALMDEDIVKKINLIEVYILSNHPAATVRLDLREQPQMMFAPM